MNLTEVKQHADANFLASEIALKQKDHNKVIAIARPILVFLSNFFLIPKKVRMILQHLIEVLDTLTPIFTKVSNIDSTQG